PRSSSQVNADAGAGATDARAGEPNGSVTAAAEELRGRASAVLTRMDEMKDRRPLFIEFAGSPKSGKSTCIEAVGHFFRRSKFTVLHPTERASQRTPFYLKGDLIAFNAWSACYALT